MKLTFRHARRIIGDVARKLLARRQNEVNQMVNLERRIGRDPHQDIVNGMTNWQRNQYARAGYPRIRAAEFLTLKREDRQKSLRDKWADERGGWDAVHRKTMEHAAPFLEAARTNHPITYSARRMGKSHAASIQKKIDDLDQ